MFQQNSTTVSEHINQYLIFPLDGVFVDNWREKKKQSKPFVLYGHVGPNLLLLVSGVSCVVNWSEVSVVFS